METIANDLSNVIIYIDNCLVHLGTHQKHLAILDKVLKCLVQQNIKMNL
jgi:hypothetical protein